MVRPLITIVILCMTAAVGIRADAGGGGGLKVGQVKLSAPIPVTMHSGTQDVFDHLEFFSHPTNGAPWKNFHTDFQSIAFPDQSRHVDDLALFGNEWSGTCSEVVETIKYYASAQQQVEHSKNILSIGAADKQKVLPGSCNQLMDEYQLIETSPAQLVDGPPAWCSVYHQIYITGKDGAWKQICNEQQAVVNAFGLTPLPYAEICTAYVKDCVAFPDGQLINCGPLTAACQNAGFQPGLACLNQVRDATALLCGQQYEPVLTKCKAGAPLTPDQLIVCRDLLEMRAKGRLCVEQIAAGTVPNVDVCTGWTEQFDKYCTKEQALAATMDFFEPAEIQSQCAFITGTLKAAMKGPAYCLAYAQCNGSPTKLGDCPQLDAVCTQYGMAQNGTCYDAAPKKMCDGGKSLQPCTQPEWVMCAGLSAAKCNQQKLLCALATDLTFPMSRLMVADVRSSGPTNQVENSAEVIFSAERLPPYLAASSTRSFPATISDMPAGAVIGGDDWFAGIVSIMRDPRPVVQTENWSPVPLGEEIEEITEWYEQYGWPAVAFFQYRGVAATPPLQLAAINSSYFGPETTGNTADGLCPLVEDKKTGAMTTAEEFKKKGCVAEKGPLGIVALNLFHETNPQSRDLVVINQGPLPYEPDGSPPRAFITVYKKKQTAPLYPVAVKDFTDVWTYHGYRPLSGMKPMEYCTYGNDAYIAINKPTTTNGKKEFFVDRVTFEGGTVKVIPIAVKLPAIIAGIADYGPYGLACGNYNSDKFPDIAVSWGKLSDDGQLVDFLNIVSIYKGEANGGFSPTPSSTLDALPIQQDGDPQPTAAHAEFASVATCDLNQDMIDDVCVGDARLYLIDGQQHAYIVYYPMTKVGAQMADMAQLHQVNTHAKYAPDNGLGGVSQIDSDRHGNVAAIIKAPRFYPPLVEIYCFDRDNDKINDEGMKVSEDGKETLYDAIIDPELKAVVDAACNQDNCPGFPPAGFVKSACTGEEIPKGIPPDGAPEFNICYNPSQADHDKDGVGDTCDNCVKFANPDQIMPVLEVPCEDKALKPIDFSKLPKVIDPVLVPEKIDEPKFELPPGVDP